jgi:hypothetical protein
VEDRVAFFILLGKSATLLPHVLDYIKAVVQSRNHTTCHAEWSCRGVEVSIHLRMELLYNSKTSLTTCVVKWRAASKERGLWTELRPRLEYSDNLVDAVCVDCLDESIVDQKSIMGLLSEFCHIYFRM